MPRGDGRGEGVDLALISYPVDAGGGHQGKWSEEAMPRGQGR